MSSHVGRRHKTWVLLQRLNKPVEEFDETPAEWETVFTVRASVEPVRSSEQVEGQQLRSFVTHRVGFRWMPGVTTQWRIVIEDGNAASDEKKRILHIESLVNWQNQNRYLDAECVER